MASSYDISDIKYIEPIAAYLGEKVNENIYFHAGEKEKAEEVCESYLKEIREKIYIL